MGSGSIMVRFAERQELRFDARVQDVRRFEAFETVPEVDRMRGRGGTDLSKPFEWYAEQNRQERVTANAIPYLPTDTALILRQPHLSPSSGF